METCRGFLLLLKLLLKWSYTLCTVCYNLSINKSACLGDLLCNTCNSLLQKQVVVVSLLKFRHSICNIIN